MWSIVGDRGCGVLVPTIVVNEASSFTLQSWHRQPSRSMTACLLTFVYGTPYFLHRLRKVQSLPCFLRRARLFLRL